MWCWAGPLQPLMVLDRNVLFLGILGMCSTTRNLDTMGECTSLPTALAWEGWNPFRWGTPGRCLQRRSALRVSGRTAAGLRVRMCPPPTPMPRGEACSHPAAAAEAGLCPTAWGCCNRVACLWHLVGCATGFVVLLRNWDAAGVVGVAETSENSWLQDGVSPGAAPWHCPSSWLAPLLVQPCTGGQQGWVALLAAG